VEVGVIQANGSHVYPGQAAAGHPYPPSEARYFEADNGLDSDSDTLYDHQEYYIHSASQDLCTGSIATSRAPEAIPYMCLTVGGLPQGQLTRTVSFPRNQWLSNPMDVDGDGDGIP